MSDSTDGYAPHFPTKFTLGNVMIYIVPLSCFTCFGLLWKAAAVLAVAIGVWRSPGFLRRSFGIAFIISVLIWGVHMKVEEDDWPGPPLLMTWWLGSFATRWHADGDKAEKDAARPEREWE